MKKLFILVFALGFSVWGMSIVYGGAVSNNVPVDVDVVSYSTTVDSTVLDYYVVNVPVPELQEFESLAIAYVEFLMDVSSEATHSLQTDLVTLDVMPFSEPVNGTLNIAEMPALSTQQSVRTGEGRSVRVAITPILRRAIAGHEGTCQVLIGAVGVRSGRFDAKVLPGGTKGALTMVIRKEEDPYVGRRTE